MDGQEPYHGGKDAENGSQAEKMDKRLVFILHLLMGLLLVDFKIKKLAFTL